MNKMSKILRKVITTSKAPAPLGPYSQAVQVNHTLYVSGQIGLDPNTNNLIEGGVQNEAKQCLENMKQIVEAAGSSMENVVKTTILLQDINDWPKVNDVYATFFKEPFPARAAFAVAALPKGCKVEIEAMAVVGDVMDE